MGTKARLILVKLEVMDTKARLILVKLEVMGTKARLILVKLEVMQTKVHLIQATLDLTIHHRAHMHLKEDLMDIKVQHTEVKRLQNIRSHLGMSKVVFFASYKTISTCIFS
jgi:hypothetical protein